jgi:hypothetical protein
VISIMRHHLPLCVSATLAASLAGAASANQPTFFGPLPYASIADSPFFGGGQVCYQLETFPGGQLSVPGLTFNSQSGAAIVAGVGVPPGGHVLQSSGLGVLQLNLPPAPGGGYPTQVGFVWTGGPNIPSTITLVVTSPGANLATQQFADLPVNPPADPSTNHFFGVQWSAGIQGLRINFSAFPATNQIDDIQFDALPAEPPMPLLPSGLDGDANPEFVWTKNSCASWYQLWVNDPLGNRVNQWFPANEVNCDQNECSITIDGLTLRDGTCTWWVRSWINGVTTPWSDGRNFRVGSDKPLTEPHLISPDGVSSSTPTFRWDHLDSASWYQVQIDDSTGVRFRQWFKAREVCGDDGECHLSPELSLAAGNATWWVRGWDSFSGMGPWSEGLWFVVDGVFPPPLPISPAPGEISGTTPTYRWEASSNATWFRLWVDVSQGDPIAEWYPRSQVEDLGPGSVPGQRVFQLRPAETLVAGPVRWWVQGWNPQERNGPWSRGVSFVIQQ